MILRQAGGTVLIAALVFAARRLESWTDWCHWRGHDPVWTGSVVACRQCGEPLGER